MMTIGEKRTPLAETFRVSAKNDTEVEIPGELSLPSKQMQTRI